VEDLWSEANLGKVNIRPYLKNKLKAKNWECGSRVRAGEESYQKGNKHKSKMN
jgi:hypothetical protein